MRNVELKRNGNLLTITVDLSVQGEASKSGKTIVLASTEGNKKLVPEPSDGDQEIFLGLNVYKK